MQQYKIYVIKVLIEEIDNFETDLDKNNAVVEYGIGTIKMFDDSSAPSEEWITWS